MLRRILTFLRAVVYGLPSWRRPGKLIPLKKGFLDEQIGWQLERRAAFFGDEAAKRTASEASAVQPHASRRSTRPR